jgi:endonuclease/exonuclease/phosphatase family metal-dependent hydrolase
MTKRVIRGAVGLLSLGVMLVPTFTAGSGQAAVPDPKYRATSAPNVFYPITGARSVQDLKTFTARHYWTDIKTPCGAGVKATHPGTALVWGSGSNWNVRVTGSNGGLVTYYSYLSKPWVSSGQVLQSGQYIGTAGRHPRSQVCELSFAVSQSRKWVNPTSWLSWYVGRLPHVERLFDAPPVTVASFNVLGASHTRSGGRFGTAAARMPRELQVINNYRADVVGLQELQDEQKAQLLQLSGTTFGIFHVDADGPTGPKPGDTDNSIIWRNSTMELVDSYTFQVPYFGGNLRRMPAVLLRQKATGRTAWFLNTHNPADVQGPAQKWRNQAVAIERQEIIKLRAQGRPVFLTGDFNDRQEAFCPLTANKLSISPNSIPATGCAYPSPSSIDWIFAAGQARFSYFARDTYPQRVNISDHPFVVTRAHLQN